MSEPSLGKPTVKELLEQASSEIVGKGIYWSEAAAEFEKIFITRALRETNGRVSKAAELIGVHRNTLTKKLRDYSIRPSTYKNSPD